MIQIYTMTEIDQILASLETRLASLETRISAVEVVHTPVPQDVKDSLKVLLDYLSTNI